MKKKKGGVGFGNVPNPKVVKNLAKFKVDPQVQQDLWAEQDARIEEIVGDLESAPFKAGVAKFYTHLSHSLELPCDVTGIEDFQWEERYIFGSSQPSEYASLRKIQPSFRDTFELMSIEQDVVSAWMLFGGEDLGAHVRRKSDGKEFCLGLAELEVVNKTSKNYQILNDYVVFFVNNR